MAWGDAMPPDGSRSGYELLLCVGAGESGRDPITEVFMATDDQSSPPPVRASKRDWERVTNNQAWSPALCLLELRDRVAALEAMAKTAALLVPKEGPALVLSEDAFQALEAAGGRASDAPAGGGLTVEKLAECLPGNAWQGPEGYNRRFFAEHLLSHPITGPRLRTEPTPAVAPAGGVTVDELEHILGRGLLATRGAARWLINHPRIGPLLRGEGAGAPKRVVLPEEPFYPSVVKGGVYYMNGCRDAWAAARAEVERQQQGVQADG